MYCIRKCICDHLQNPQCGHHIPMYCTVWSMCVIFSEILLKVKDLEELVELMKKDTEQLQSEAVETNRVLCQTKEVIHR